MFGLGVRVRAGGAAAVAAAGAGGGAPQRARSIRPASPGSRMVHDDDIGAEGMAGGSGDMAEAMAAEAVAQLRAGAADLRGGNGGGQPRARALEGRHRRRRSARWRSTARVDLTQLPAGSHAIGCKWVFRASCDADGNVVRCKARLVAQGFAQREGVDFWETFAPVLHYKTLRVIAGGGGQARLRVQADGRADGVPQRHVQGGRLHEGAQGFGRAGLDAGMVLKLKKTLYGIKQAPREWNIEFNDAIVALGYTRCSSDTCVYVKHSRSGKAIIIPVFVDDVFPACATEDLPEMMADLRGADGQVRHQGVQDADVVLGMRVTRDRKAGTLEARSGAVREEATGRAPHGGLQAGADAGGGARQCGASGGRGGGGARRQRSGGGLGGGEDARKLQEKFRKLVGALLYAALSTRPDIAHASTALARAVSNPTGGALAGGEARAALPQGHRKHGAHLRRRRATTLRG